MTTLAMPVPDHLPAIPVAVYPEPRHPSCYDREYLLDVAAAATTRQQPGSEPAAAPLMSSTDHVEAICRLALDLSRELEQLPIARGVAAAFERALAVERAANAKHLERVLEEQERNAQLTTMLTSALADALRQQQQNIAMSNELAITRHAMAAVLRKLHDGRTVSVEASHG